MLRSMTGYGKSSVSNDICDIDVEIKSVNHRFLDLNFRMPSVLNKTEMELRKSVRSCISRGSLSIFMNINYKSAADNIRKIDFEAAGAYKELLEDLKNKLGIDQEITLDMILKFQDLFNHSDDKNIDDSVEDILLCFETALKDLIAYREKEGKNIYSDLEKYLKELNVLTDRTAEFAKDCAKIQFERLLSNIKSYTDPESLSKERLEQELVIISDKVDISEEISRLRSHISLFKDTMDKNEPSGKIINNLSQEMHREASTISAKTNLTEISHLSVKMKEIIEMIREQVQNVE